MGSGSNGAKLGRCELGGDSKDDDDEEEDDDMAETLHLSSGLMCQLKRLLKMHYICVLSYLTALNKQMCIFVHVYEAYVVVAAGRCTATQHFQKGAKTTFRLLLFVRPFGTSGSGAHYA